MNINDTELRKTQTLYGHECNEEQVETIRNQERHSDR